MLQSVSNPGPGIGAGTGIEHPRNRWAVLDLFVFGLFFVGLLALVARPLAGLPVATPESWNEDRAGHGFITADAALSSDCF